MPTKGACVSHSNAVGHKEDEAGVTIPTPIPMPSATQAPTENKEGKRGFREWLNILAYPISAAIGIYAGRENIRQNSYEMFKRQGAFDQLIADTKAEADKIRAKAENPDYSVSKEIKKVRDNFGEKVSKLFKKWKYNTMLDHFSTLSSQAKHESLIVGGTVTGIALGAMLMIANSKNIFNGKNRDKEEDNISR